MTITEKIIAKHCNKKNVVPGEIVECNVDIALGNDITAPIAIEEFGKTGAKKVFNNTKVVGKKDCATYTVGQVGVWGFGDDFEIDAGGGAGASCPAPDNFDATLDVSVTLSDDQGAWECKFVKQINVTTDGGYVTEVTYECGSISGSTSCSGKKWITAIDCGCTGGLSGGGTG